MRDRLRQDSLLVGAPWLAGAVLITGLVASLSAFLAVRAELESHRKMEFQWVAHNRNNALKKGIEDGLEAVRSVRDLFNAAEQVSREDFARYARALFARYRGIQALEWVPLVTAETRDAHERAGRVTVPGYQVRERGSGNALQRAAARETYFPILFMEPLYQAGQWFGFDYGSSPLHRALMERAWSSGRMAVSGRIKLLKGDDSQYGFQAFLPVYAAGATTAGTEQRRTTLLGFAVGVFRIDQLANASISLLEPRGVEFLIRDESAPRGEQFLDFYASRLTPHTPVAADSRVSPGWNIEDAPKASETFPVADRLWSITCSPTRQFRSAEGFRQGPLIVLGGGLLLTLIMALFVGYTRRGMRARLRIEQELRQSEQKLRILFDQSPDIIVTLDREGRVLLANRPIPEVHVDGAIGRPFVGFLPERYHERYWQAVSRAFDAGEADAMGFSRDDSSWWELRTVPLKLEGGVAAVMLIATDVTEKRLLEAQAIRHARLASLGVIVASVAHEINNPNNSIRFNASILARSWTDIAGVLSRFREEYGDFSVGGVPVDQALSGMPRLLDGIDKGARRIEGIVGNLKHLARPDAGELDHAVDLAEVLRTSLSILQSQILKYCDDCKLEMDEPLAPVRGNAQQLEQVFINLILNALESLSRRSAAVRIRAALEAEAEFVRVTVGDQGCGIPEELRGRVLDPFFTTKGKQGGTGLGLAIAYRIVQNHGGRMEILSTPGKGTEVVVRLPVSGSV